MLQHVCRRPNNKRQHPSFSKDEGGITCKIVDEEISIGDYVLTGGEIPAMVLIDSISRYVDGVISNESISEESFSNNMLEYPQYTPLDLL